MERAIPFSQQNEQRSSSTDDGFFFGQQQTSSSVDYESVGIFPTGNTYTQIGFPIASTTSSDGILFPSSTTASQTADSTGFITTTPSQSQSHTRAGESQSSTSATPISISQQHQHANSSSLSPGELAAAIIVPILFVLLAGGLLFLFLLRRRKRNNQPQTCTESRSSFLPFAVAGGMKEKWTSSHRSVSSSSSAPEVTNTTNNAYFTGLDTSSHGSRSQEVESPPPPYVPRPSTAAVRNALPEVPHVNIDFDAYSPAPPSPTTHASRAATGLNSPRMDRLPSSRSARSFSSDLYSDTASVHSARAARRSFGPNVIQPVASGSFGDAGDANSPVSSLGR